MKFVLTTLMLGALLCSTCGHADPTNGEQTYVSEGTLTLTSNAVRFVTSTQTNTFIFKAPTHSGPIRNISYIPGLLTVNFDIKFVEENDHLVDLSILTLQNREGDIITLVMDKPVLMSRITVHYKGQAIPTIIWKKCPTPPGN